MLASSGAALGAQVTFQVNLSAQVALGNFDPAADAVSVAGDPINGWSPSTSFLAASPGDPNLWTGTFDVAGEPGATAQYKFVMVTANATTWEGNVGSGGGNENRTFTLTEADQTLPVVFFNNVTSGVNVSSDVTFQVNMSVQTELGVFDPEAGTVNVAGEFNGWNTSDFLLTRSASDANLWVGTRQLTGAANSSVSYKFVMNGGTWEGNVGPNGAQNRSLTLTSAAQTLPAVFFNNVTAVPTDIPLTFQVNLSIPIAQGTFDPESGTVTVAGDLLNNWDTTASVLTRNAADPNLWTGTFEVSSTAGATVLYKFVLNSSTWESMADNRAYILASTDPQTVPLAYFSNVNNLGPVSAGAVTGGQITLSWTAGPLIRLQTASDLKGAVWQDVPDSLGQGSATVPVGSGRAFYQLAAP